MNILGYQRLEIHGLSFEILVDGKPISALVGSSDTSIPYWLFETRVALYPITRISSDTEQRVVAVCYCGAFGCSCISCNIVRGWDDNIVFRDFATDPYDPNPDFAIFNI